MVTPVKFTREFGARPIDRITGEQGENRGASRLEMDLTYTVRASLGAVQLVVRVQLDPEVAWRRGYKIIDPRTVSSHFKRKLNDLWIESESCDVLEHGHCFGATGYLVADTAWEKFRESEEVGWAFLEEIYNDWRKF